MSEELPRQVLDRVVDPNIMLPSQYGTTPSEIAPAAPGVVIGPDGTVGTPDIPGALGVPGSPDGPPAAGEAAPDGVGAPGGTIEATATTPSAAEAADGKARYTDAELLGRSFRVRRAVQEVGTQRIKVWQGLRAKVRNALDTPGKHIRQFAYNRAKNSHARKEARLQTAASERLWQHRQASVDKAKGRLDHRQSSLNHRTERMENRTKAVHENANRRRQEYIDELKGRRGNALARKAVRKQLRTEGASRREARKILAEMPAEGMDRVGKVAIVSETSRRQLKGAERMERRADKRLLKTERRITWAEERIDRHDQTAEAADKTLAVINDMLLPQARRRVSELKRKLQDIVEPDDPDGFARIDLALQQAEAEVAEYNSELQYWQDAAAGNRRKSDKATNRREELKQVHGDQKGSAEAAAGHVKIHRDTHGTDKEKFSQEVRVVLNGK